MFASLSRFLAARASWVVIATALVAFLFPSLFLWVKGTVQTVILGLIMLTMGLTLSTDDFRVVARRPWDFCIGAVAQFCIMPLVAYVLVHVFRLEPALAIGILLVGSCPGGVSSNIMSFLCKGDVAFSVGMTCVSTLLAPVMTPLLMELTAGQIIEIDAVGMFVNILIVTIIPVGIGSALNYFFSPRPSFPKIQSLMPGLSVICLAFIVGSVISAVHDILVARGLALFALTFCVVFCHNTLGYVLGYATGRAFGFSVAKKRTISIEVGMQNAGLATNLASTFFVAEPLAVLPCAISCAWHSISGTILAGLFVRIKWLAVGLLLLVPSHSHAQADSTCADGEIHFLRKNFEVTCKNEHIFLRKNLIAPACLISAGAVGIGIKSWREGVRDAMQGLKGDHSDITFPYFHKQRRLVDDNLQYFPFLLYGGMGCFGVQSKHRFYDRVMTGATAYLIEAAMVNGLKYMVREGRPNTGRRNSFPSGHTTTAFTGAELARLEYGWSVGAPAYAVALTTAFLRMYHNRHWYNDVLAGAGIGIFAANAAYWLYPLERRWFTPKKRFSQSGAFVLVPTYDVIGKAPGLSCQAVF
ncbi:MAG: phosphatase PAP2 family protein [Bacteroidaceae bacterium]|nr:phosphatase PAP2 family protein [Bacteroidaceae bacterium]